MRPASCAEFRDWLLAMDRARRCCACSIRASAGRRCSAAQRLIAALARTRRLAADRGAADRLHRGRGRPACASAKCGCARATCGMRSARRSRSPACSRRTMVHGRELVDGGLLAPLPIAATRLSDAHRLIAVDMHGWPQRPPGEPARSGARRRARRRTHRGWSRVDGATRDDRRAGRCGARTRLGFTESDGALARHDAGADRARAAGAGSAGTGDPHPARRLPVLRVLAREGADRDRRATKPRRRLDAAGY